MLNVGILGSAAAEYYAGEVATSAEDYYTGHGEAAGRWVGSLAAELGLVGQVDTDHFRAVLDGKHPFTGEYLVSSQGNAQRAARRREPVVTGASPGDVVGTLRAAAQLGVSAQYVRQLLADGERYEQRLAGAEGGEVVVPPRAYLIGRRGARTEPVGGDRWGVPRSELERFASTRHQTKARPGYDLTLRPPKSVSIVWALADEQRRFEIRRAHAEAVDQVVRYYENAAVRGRAGKGARYLLETAGVVAAAFDHRTSRAGDPLLHTHVVTANMTRVIRSDDEQEWRAISSPPLFEHARAAGHLYQAHLRHLLATRLGIEFMPVVNGHADVAGVPDDVVSLFSKRRHEIEEVLFESGRTSARAAQFATLDTRQAKDYGVDAGTLQARWQAEATEMGFGPDDALARFDRATPAALGTPAIDRLFENLAGPYGLTERAATFTRTSVIEAVASAVGTACTAARIEELADRFLGSDRALLVEGTAIVQTSPDPDTPARQPARDSARRSARRSATQKLYTTPELARLEEQLLDWGSAGHDPATPIVPAGTVDAVLDARPELSVEQAAMVRAACSAGEGLQAISGRPGAGKTYGTEAVVAAHVAAGIPIFGCAISATAAGELERAAGFARSTGRPATTVARLLLELDDPSAGGLASGSVVIVDEASMIGTRELARLAAHARRAGGAIKLVGDPDQHGSVDVGGVFQRLCWDRGARLVRLVENNRQEDHTERLAVTDYREDRVADALARYDEANKIVRSATAGESFDAIVTDWYAARLHGDTDPMIAGPNSTRRALNDRARALLEANGQLTGPAFAVGGREFKVGDEVVARRNDRTLRSGASAEFVKNGSTGTVTALDAKRGELVVDFDREGTIRLPHAYLAAGRLEHGYARTTYGVQGATHEVARYHPTDVSSFEEGYVAITRARSATRIYIVDGTLSEPDDDLTHAPPETEPFGLDDIADVLGRRRAGHMATDTAARLSGVAATLAGKTLPELTVAREKLDRRLTGAPADATRAIAEATQTRDAILARRQAWTATRTEAEELLRDPATEPETRRDAETAAQRSRRKLETLDRAHSRILVKLRAARRQQSERNLWLDTHADDIAERDLTSRAERARETQIRVTATHDVARPMREVLGDEPASQRERLAWRHAIEAAAIHRARYETEPVPGGEGYEWALGPRPDDKAAARSYGDATITIDAALAELDRAAGADSAIEL